jgi:hypothetical protein
MSQTNPYSHEWLPDRTSLNFRPLFENYSHASPEHKLPPARMTAWPNAKAHDKIVVNLGIDKVRNIRCREPIVY